MSDNILQQILAVKAGEVQHKKQHTPVAMLQEIAASVAAPRGFAAALQHSLAHNKPAVIAEIKKASPSQGVIRPDFQPAAIAADYAINGASCLSVLTDKEFFQGAEAYLQLAREACPLPVLRKDFIIDPYQIYESRALGADCILLIVAALSDPLLQQLADLATEQGMDVLVEVHTSAELDRALLLPTPLVGINNRNLKTFTTSLATSIALKQNIPKDRIAICESGIHTPADVRLMQDNGINAYLIGETFMRATSPGAKMRQLFAL